MSAPGATLQPTSAKLILTKGNVIPADLTKRIGAPAARDLYATVCRAIVTAPVLPDRPHSCPAMAVDPGTANVEFLVGDRRVDTIEMMITGCESIQSARVGGLGGMGADFGNFEKATLAIHRAFDVTDKAFRSR